MLTGSEGHINIVEIDSINTYDRSFRYYIMISGTTGSCLHDRRLLNLDLAEYKEAAFYAVNQRIPHVREISGGRADCGSRPSTRKGEIT